VAEDNVRILTGRIEESKKVIQRNEKNRYCRSRFWCQKNEG